MTVSEGYLQWDLSGHAVGQIRKASTGHALQGLGAEAIPPDMLTGAPNNKGAYLRAAYWLAIASRIAQARGIQSSSLTAAASTNMAAATAGGDSDLSGMFNPFYWWYRPTWTDNMGSILSEAAVLCERHGIYDVGAILRRAANPANALAQQAAVQARAPDLATTLATQARESLDPRPDWMRTKGFQIGTYAVLGLIGLGLTAWFLRWSIGPYVGAARGAYRMVT